MTLVRAPDGRIYVQQGSDIEKVELVLKHAAKPMWDKQRRRHLRLRRCRMLATNAAPMATTAERA
jgi:hypothetical protein